MDIRKSGDVTRRSKTTAMAVRTFKVVFTRGTFKRYNHGGIFPRKHLFKMKYASLDNETLEKYLRINTQSFIIIVIIKIPFTEITTRISMGIKTKESFLSKHENKN